MRYTSLSFLFWATTSTALGQNLVPMNGETPATSNAFVPMNAMVDREVQDSKLEPMAGPNAGEDTTIYSPMMRAEDQDITVSAMNGSGPPEIMKGGRDPSETSPVQALMPLQPPVQAKIVDKKPVVLKKQKPAKVVKAAGSGDEQVSPLPSSLTDVELSPNLNIPTVSRPDEQLIAADIVLNDIPRQTLLEVYQDDKQVVWLPLTPLAKLLEMPLNVNSGAGVAQGWYQTPSNTVVIDMAADKVTVGKQVFAAGRDIEKHAADLYINNLALKAWLGVETQLDYNELRLYLKTPQPLPGDVRASRMETWDKTTHERQRQQTPSDTIIPPYADYSLPVLRLGTNMDVSKPAGNNAAVATGLTVQSESDLLGMNTNIALGFAQTNGRGKNGFTGGSVLLQKQSELSDLLGPMQARYFALGDITANPIPLSNASSRGRGITANNLPRGAVSNPDQYILTGPAPINWDVEVYQNATLVAFERINTSGMYRFSALPLRSGRNTFRIVLYGPNGEQEERRETIYLAGNIPDVGQTYYETSVFQQNRSVIPGKSTAVSGTELTSQAQFTTGLGNKWAATLGGFKTLGSPVANDYKNKAETEGISTGLRGSYGETYLTTDLFAGGQGNAVQGSVRAPLTRFADLRVGTTRNYGFETLERDMLTEHEAEISVPLLLGRTAIDTTYGYTRTTYQSQKPQDSFNQRTSVAMGPLNATNQLAYVQQGESKNLNGTLESAIHVFQTSWRAGLNYRPDSTQVMRNYYVNTQLPLTNDRTLNLTYTQQLADSRTASLAGSMYWNAGPLALGLQGQGDTTGNIQVGLNLTTALIPQGYRQAKWKLAPPTASIGQGQAVVRVFADDNGNNRYDAGEAVLPNVTVTNRLRGNQQITNANGLAIFPDLSPNTLTRFEIDLTSLPDIYLKPVSDTLNVKPHVGDNGMLDYAIRVYGEVSGQAFNKEGRPVQNLSIKLLDANGRVADSTETAHDGFYTFGALALGAYTLKAEGAADIPVAVTGKSRILTHNMTVAF